MQGYHDSVMESKSDNFPVAYTLAAPRPLADMTRSSHRRQYPDGKPCRPDPTAADPPISHVLRHRGLTPIPFVLYSSYTYYTGL